MELEKSNATYNRKRHKIYLILTLIPVIVTAIMIFCFSAQTGEESSKTSGKVVEKVVEIVKPDIEELPELEREEWINKLQHWVRKTAHFLEYTMFGFFLLLHIRVRGDKHAAWWAVGIGAAYAATDEFHQFLTGSRSGQVADVLLDSTGVFVGVMIMQILWLYFSKIYDRRKINRQK